METEWLRATLPPVAILGAAALAWLTRRAERLKDAYADWAAAVFALVSSQSACEPNARFALSRSTPNPEWIAWNAAWGESLAALRSARAVLHTREPSTKLRARVDQLSTFGKDTDLNARVREVEDLLATISNESWLLLSMRHIDAT